VNACEVKAHQIRCWQNLGAVCFWQPIPSGLNLVVAAVLRDSLCVGSLLPCEADCCMLYTVCNVERFVLTIIKQRLLLLLLFTDCSLQVWSPQLTHMVHAIHSSTNGPCPLLDILVAYCVLLSPTATVTSTNIQYDVYFMGHNCLCCCSSFYSLFYVFFRFLKYILNAGFKVAYILI